MNYELGSDLEVPGLEAVLEYGYASTVERDRIPGAYQINDQLSALEHVRLTQISGIQDDPDAREARESKSDLHGEDTGRLFYDGRTIGLTGVVQAGNIPRMRDEWRRFKSQFQTGNKDLLLHSPFEVPILYNEVFNPDVYVDNGSGGAASWSGFATNGTRLGPLANVSDGFDSVGSVATSSTTGAGILSSDSNLVEWGGQDVFIAARVKLHSSAAAGSQQLTLSLVEESLVGSTNAPNATSVFLSTGSWAWLTLRLTASQLQVTTRRVGVRVSLGYPSTNGTYEIRFHRAMLVFLQSTDASPVGYFGERMLGFENEGAIGASRSFGPCYLVNSVSDPQFTGFDPSSPDVLLTWLANNGASVTVNKNPIGLPRKLTGSTLDRSMYYKATKDATTTARTIAVRNVDRTSGQGRRVAEGRTYRASAIVNVVQKPTTDAFTLFIQWKSLAGTVLSTTSSPAAQIGTSTLEVEATAPAGAVLAVVNVGVVSTTQSGAVVEFFMTDPSFVDVSDFDSNSSFWGLDVMHESYSLEQMSTTTTPITIQVRADRLIPRPWLIRKVRKGADGPKAPEQQNRSRAWRDFTMSLRAADPRIYVLDERRRSLHLVGISQFVALQGDTGFTIGSVDSGGVVTNGGLPIRTGFTYEGHYVTYPGAGINYFWSKAAYNYTATVDPPSVHPNDGVGIQSWNTATGSSGLNRPTSDLRTRMYRSAEGYTYQNPKVIVGGSPSGGGESEFVSPDSISNFNVVLGGDNVVYSTYLTALLKRVSSSTWLEVRWSGLSAAYSNHLYAGAFPTPNTFEIWCSHTAAGAAGTTKLQAWDYTSYDSTSGNFPFNPVTDEMYLVTWMTSNTIYVELWRGYPSPIDLSGRLESFSFALPAPLVSIVGSGVAGHAGVDMMIPRGDSTTTWIRLAGHPPFMHYFEASKADVPPVTIAVPVIGEIDTPPKLVLSDMVDPVISITTPAYEDLPATTTVARFSGTITTTNPISIDLSSDPGNPMVVDSDGANAYDLLITGSRFQMLRPGINYVTVQAKSWGSSAEHVQVAWKDAVK